VAGWAGGCGEGCGDGGEGGLVDRWEHEEVSRSYRYL
jgi:hypothetical protein